MFAEITNHGIDGIESIRMNEGLFPTDARAAGPKAT